MLDYIAKLRRKPVRERKQIAFASTFSLSLIVLAIWVTTFGVDKKATVEIKDVVSPFSVVFSSVKSAGENMKDKFSTISNSIGSPEYKAEREKPTAKNTDIDNILYLGQLTAATINASTTHETH